MGCAKVVVSANMSRCVEFFLLNTLIIIIIIIIKPRLMRHMSVTKEDESQAWGHVIVYG